MKNLWLFSFFSVVCAILALPCKGLIVPVDSSIETASLFSDGALVTRRANSVQVPAGKTTLQFVDLPGRVDTTFLQPELLVMSGDRHGLVRNAKIYQPKDRSENLAITALKERLHNVTKERDTKARIILEAKEDIDFATSMRESFVKEFGRLQKEGESHALDQAKALTDFVAETRATANARIDSIETELQANEKIITAIEKDLKEQRENFQLLSSVAEVEIEMDGPGVVDISITYLAKTATWKPQYELRAFPDKGMLDFGYFASIQQQTCEEWSNITLSIHTNQVQRQGNVPELRPLHVHIRQPYISPSSSPGRWEKYGNSESKELYSGHLFESQVDHRSGLDADEMDEEVTIATSKTSYQVTVPGLVSIPSSSTGAVYKVLEAKFSADFWSESVPSLQVKSYLRAKLLNNMEIPILPGNAIAFVDGKMSSKVHLGRILPQEDASVSLGADDNIVIKRIKGALKDSETGYFSLDKTRRISREYINDVTNLHQFDHKVVIVDQWPIARDDKIHIQRKLPMENDVRMENTNDGLFQWNATLAPKERKTFVTAYDVAHPRDWGTLSTEL